MVVTGTSTSRMLPVALTGGTMGSYVPVHYSKGVVSSSVGVKCILFIKKKLLLGLYQGGSALLWTKQHGGLQPRI